MFFEIFNVRCNTAKLIMSYNNVQKNIWIESEKKMLIIYFTEHKTESFCGLFWFIFFLFSLQIQPSVFCTIDELIFPLFSLILFQGKLQFWNHCHVIGNILSTSNPSTDIQKKSRWFRETFCTAVMKEIYNKHNIDMSFNEVSKQKKCSASW